MKLTGMERDRTLDLSIVIVNWNSTELLRNCLISIFSQRHQFSFELWVVDNASADRTIESVVLQFPHVHVILNESNAGFPKANNQAIAQCKGRNILLLNPDTIIIEDALDLMVRFLDSHPEIGAVGPRLLNGDGTIQYSGARVFPTPWLAFCEVTGLRRVFPRSRVFGQAWIGHWDHRDSREIECLSGACLMVKRNLFNQIGLLDETHFMYLEDIDLCFRISRSGAKLYYLADAEVVHFQGQSSKQVTNRDSQAFLVYEAYWRFIQRFYGLPNALIYRAGIIIGSGLRIGVQLVGMTIYLIWHKPYWLSPLMFFRYIKLFFWGLGWSRISEPVHSD